MRVIHVLAFLTAFLLPIPAFAEPGRPDPDAVDDGRDGPLKLSLFAGAGYLASAGANGGAVSTGVRLAAGRYFALGFDFGYGLLATSSRWSTGSSTPTGMEDRWWFIPSMAVVAPTHVGRVPASFDVGAGLGLGTSSGYGSWGEYAAHPFTATWEYQLEPTVRAHAIAAFTVSPTVDLYARADANALVLPHGVGAGFGDSTWLMLSVGTRFRVL